MSRLQHILFSHKAGLAIILLTAFILRFYHLTFQSLWLDELHTMVECDPGASWSDLTRYLKCCDLQPPLYHAIQKIALSLFGYTAFVARSLSVIAGTLSVWGMYLFGKELLNKNLGLIAAAVTAVNYFAIYHSQDARNYALAFLFCILSFLFLIRLIKSPGKKTAVYYVLFTLCMIYTHYFGLFAFASQVTISTVFFFAGTENKKQYFKVFAAAVSAVIVGYLPWLFNMIHVASTNSGWITSVSDNFAVDFFYEYFGNSNLLKPFLFLFLILFASSLPKYNILSKQESLKSSVLSFSFTILLLWIFVSCFIPYLQSIFTVPVLYPRYTIVVLPAFLLALSIGIEVLPDAWLKFIVLAIFCILSLTDILFVKNYYTRVNKTQFREVSEYIVSNNAASYPVINYKTAWHQSYYLKRMGSKAPLIGEEKGNIIDSLIRKTIKFDGFWLVSAHNAVPLSDDEKKGLDSTYIPVTEKYFFDAWVQLYVSPQARQKEVSVLTNENFSRDLRFESGNEKVIALWGGAISSDTFIVKAGEYGVHIVCKGTAAENIFPHIKVQLNEKPIGEFYTTGNYQQVYAGSFKLEKEQACRFSLEMDNDLYDPSKKEDRNAFIQSIIIYRLQ